MNPGYENMSPRRRTTKKIFDLRKILYCESDRNYTHVYFKGHDIVVSKSLNNFESTLPSGLFFRIHRSLIINTGFVTDLNDASVILLSKIELKVARRRRSALIKELKSKYLVY
jgi:two-component system LytT family response regulator